MIMNMKLTAALAALVAAGGMSAFGQGYVLFNTSKNDVYDNFTTQGTSVVAPGDVTATFLWAGTGTSNYLGAGLATAATSSAGGWASIATMLSSGWTIGANYNGGAAATEADVTDNAGGTQKGALPYNAGTSFQLNASTAGASYEFVVIAWDNLGGAATLGAAETAAAALGWSSAFTYATGATSSSGINNFSQSGEAAFGVAPGSTPEPTSLALAGLGGLSMLLLRRRKS